MNGKKRIAVMAAGTLLATMPAAAQADVQGWNFEQPRFVLGDIHAQDGWMKTGATYDVEVEQNSGALTSLFGGQSLRISNAVTSGSFGDQTFSDSLVDAAGETTSADAGIAGGVRQTTFVSSFDFTSADPSGEQVGLGVSVAPDRGDGGRMSNLRLRDTPTGLQIDVSHVPSPALTAGAVTFETVSNIAGDLPRGGRHNVRIAMTFVEGPDNDVVRVFVNGVEEFVGESWENYYRNDAEQTPSGNLVPATDALLFRASGAAAPANAGKGFLVDNVRLESFGGPSGPVGPQGPQGPAGDDGDDGDDGTDGTNGTNGAAGAAGPQGSAGSQGPAGAQGLPGATTPLDVPEIDPPTIGSAGRVSSKRVLKVKLSCPAGVSLCEGWLTLRAGNKTLARSPFLIRAGRTGTVSLKLSSATVRSIRSGKLKNASAVVFARDGAGTASEATKSVALRLAR